MAVRVQVPLRVLRKASVNQGFMEAFSISILLVIVSILIIIYSYFVVFYIVCVNQCVSLNLR